MDVVLQLLGVAAIAVVELWAAVPAGLAMGLPAPLVWVATLAGAFLSIVVVVAAGDRLRTWLVERFGHGGAREGGRLRRLWDRYGVIGWGLLAPLLLGAPLAAAIGVALGAGAAASRALARRRGRDLDDRAHAGRRAGRRRRDDLALTAAGVPCASRPGRSGRRAQSCGRAACAVLRTAVAPRGARTR